MEKDDLLFDKRFGRFSSKNPGELPMLQSQKKPRVRILKFRIPKFCICPSCGKKQRFKKKSENWKTVKDINSEKEIVFKVRTVYAKCLNQDCSVKYFALPTPGIERYARVTNRLKEECINSLIEGNDTFLSVSDRLTRSFNTSGSKSSIDRWKHKEADKYNAKEIITKLEFSGILSLDAWKPQRSKTYNLLDSDVVKGRLLYVDNLPTMGAGYIEKHLRRLKKWTIIPRVIIVDLWKGFLRPIKRVFPDSIIQYDFYHVMKQVHWYLHRALTDYRKSLKEQGNDILASELWEHKWLILKNMEKWTSEQHKTVESLMQTYKGTIIEDIFILKEQVRSIFDYTNSIEEAYAKREQLAIDGWQYKSTYFRSLLRFLFGKYFPYMIAFLSHKDKHIPRAGNSETMIEVFRRMERPRYGFKSQKGRLNHLKLYQINKYLKGKLD